MLPPASPIPEICISLAPPASPVKEPVSPFAPLSPGLATDDQDGFRALLLSPPPVISPNRQRLSPLNPCESNGKGLERDRFESLLKTSRERNAALGSKRTTDLRKEVALKAHKSKQMERRALFLSKVQAPPSPSATCLPKTPPESPSVFHYSLPSPGLVSPLALFDSPEAPNRQPRVEQVEWVSSTTPERSPVTPRAKARKSIPSLDQITERLKSQGHVQTAAPAATRSARRVTALPAFLQVHAKESVRTLPEVEIALSVEVPRLQEPVRTPSPPAHLAENSIASPPKSPDLHPKLHVKTTVVPHASMQSPDHLTEENLALLNVRERSAQDMLSTLRRRTLGAPRSQDGGAAAANERRGKRNSAPAELQKAHRLGFMHPILLRPGAF